MVNIVEMIKGSFEELRKVTWPKKDDVVRATIPTCIFVVIFSGILFGVDVISRLGLQELMK